MYFVYKGHCDLEYPWIQTKCESQPFVVVVFCFGWLVCFFLWYSSSSEVWFLFIIFFILLLFLLAFSQFNSMDIKKGVPYTSKSNERIKLSNSAVYCASVQHCSSQINRLYGLGSFLFNICPIISFLSVCHFFQYLFLCSSLLPPVTSYFSMGSCLADTWQLGWGTREGE